MRILSKLTALLLALMMVLAAPLTVSAENQVIRTMDEYYEQADRILHDLIMSFETYGEYESMASLIENDDFIAFFGNLSEEQQEAMANYIIRKFWASCISYTSVGPFMPPIQTGTQARGATFTAQPRDAASDAEGLYLNKTADPTPNSDGTYTITLEAYVTGTVKVEQVDTFNPADIVLVLDTSGSMAYDFAGNNTNNNANTRGYALQNAVSNFIDTVGEKYDAANGVDHRIAIVDFDSDDNGEYGVGVRVNAPLTPVDANGVRTLKAAIPANEDFAGGTEPAPGLNSANTLLSAPYTGNSTKDRSKVVVLFTDGIPEYTNGFNATWAKNAIDAARTMKSKGYTVFSVAIISGANPSAAINSWYYGNSDANIANRLLHAISSNYPTASQGSSYGRNYVIPGDPNYTIDSNDDGINDTLGHYLTASSAADLNSIFQGIASNIESGATTSTLTETTVVSDVISPYFELPYTTNADGSLNYDAANITITEYNHTGDDANGNPTWTVDTGASNATYEIVDGNKLNITNFNFQENAVVTLTNNNQKEYEGKKLVISFVVKPTDGFLGGDGVVTNDGASGVYQPGADGTLVPVEAFRIPVVNVDVPPLQIIGEDQHIYLGNNASLDEMLQSFSVYYNIVDASGTKVSGPHKVDSILNHYVQLDFDLKLDNVTYATYSIEAAAKKGNWTYNNVTSETLNVPFTEDETFHIAYTATATESNQSDGDMTANIYVYTPEVTFKDSEHEYLAPATADGYYDENNCVSIAWYNANKKQYSTAATVVDAETGKTVSAMLGTAPVLTYTYTPESDTWITDGKVTGTACVPVNVTQVVIDGDNDITISEANNTGYLKTLRQVIDCTDCANKDGKATETSVADPNLCEFVVHIHNVFADLTINKAGMSNGESAVVQVVVNANGTDQTYMLVFNSDNETAIIAGLPIGSTYAVTELNSWSWRYNDGVITYVNTEKKIVADETRNVVNITNTRSNDQWMSDESAVENNLGTGSSAGHNNQ